MIARSMVAAAAVVALAVGAGPASAAEKAAAKPRKELTDRNGNKLSLELDQAGKVVGRTAADAKGKPLDVVEIAMKDTTVCIPGPKRATLCQPLAYVSEEAEVKMGTATCTCRVYNGVLLCYGDSCH